MVAKEGFFSIYKGLSASWAREASYSGIRFGAYDLCKSSVLHVIPLDKDSFGIKLAAGMASGMLGAGIANPADVVRFSCSLDLTLSLARERGRSTDQRSSCHCFS